MNKLMLILHNNKTQITGEKLIIHRLQNSPEFKIKDPNYFHMVQRGLAKGWDGYKRYITEGGLIATGLVPKLVEVLEKLGIAYDFLDKRDLFKEITDITQVGELTLRGYQKESAEAFLTNKLMIAGKEIRWQRGILNEATNSGKNLIAAAIFSSFSTKRNGLFLINSKIIFQQAVEELTQLLGRDIVGMVSAARTDWKRFNICMVQTLCNRIKSVPQIRKDLANNDILFVDEGDEVIGRKDTQTILTTAFNSPVRCSLTGTSGLSKSKQKNINEIGYFGPIIHRTTNKQLTEQGYSSKPIIKIHEGNIMDIPEISWQDEYMEFIVKNKDRNKKVWKRVRYNAKRGRLPLLVLFKLHEHAKFLMKTIPKDIKEKYRIGIAHGKIKNREHILARFKEEKIDILLCSMIIRRGKNLPSMKCLINAAAGDSHANALQILGRLLRKGKKNKKYFEDFWDKGKHLRRHSYHRTSFYKREGYPIKELHKNKH